MRATSGFFSCIIIARFWEEARYILIVMVDVMMNFGTCARIGRIKKRIFRCKALKKMGVVATEVYRIMLLNQDRSMYVYKREKIKASGWLMHVINKELNLPLVHRSFIKQEAHASGKDKLYKVDLHTRVGSGWWLVGHEIR